MVKIDEEDNEIISCGFDKWDISITKWGALHLNFNRNPISGSICLGDLSKDESIDLAKMFCKFAIKDSENLEKIINLIDLEYNK